jgi:type III secretion protein V
VSSLHALLSRLRGAGDVLLALAVLALVVLLVAPLPPAALDALIASNLAASATLLVVTLFARDALRFASFPTLLLLTTLFRVALSVSSTRLLLSRGEAGRVIEAFGRVVVQGDPVVGVVVFAILTLVQLLVVAKGAERVAEVAARFTLDALPGKQMAIDAELRAGTLDAGEARRRRRALERESQLHGAMDGALKFVKGDAIAGVAIVLVNLVGGVAAGAARGLDLGAAARRYALLAVGDGLASQVPALLVAVSAGLAVTRVAAEEEGETLSGEIGRQLVAEPAALFTVAALLGALALSPGLPAAPFGSLALAAAGAGAWVAQRRSAGKAREAPGPRAAAAPAGTLGPPAPVVLELAADLVATARADDDRFVREGLAALRERLWRELGVSLPAVAIRPAPLPPGGWCLLLDEVPAASGRAPAGEVLSLAAPDELSMAGLDAAPADDPSTGRPAGIVPASQAARAAALGTVLGPLERVAAGAGAALLRRAHELLGVQEAQALLDTLEASAPALVREAGRQLPPALVAEVLRRLLEEGVSIRPLRTVLEAMLEAGGAPRGTPALVDAARRALRRHIGHRFAGQGPMRALLLEPAAEHALREGLAGDGPALEPALAMGLLDRLDAELGAAGREAVLLASPDVRRALWTLVAPRFPRLPVLTFEELPPELPVRPVGRLGLPAPAGPPDDPRAGRTP